MASHRLLPVAASVIRIGAKNRSPIPLHCATDRKADGFWAQTKVALNAFAGSRSDFRFGTLPICVAVGFEDGARIEIDLDLVPPGAPGADLANDPALALREVLDFMAGRTTPEGFTATMRDQLLAIYAVGLDASLGVMASNAVRLRDGYALSDDEATALPLAA
jgi:hypothetical protein